MKFRSILAALLMTTGALVVTAGSAQAASTCNDPIPPPSCAPNEGPPAGRIEVIQRIPNGIRVAGWAADPDADTSTVRVKINGVTAGLLTAGKPHPSHGNAGFDGVVATKSGDQVCISVPNAPNGGETVVDCKTWPVRYDPFGSWATMDRAGASLSLSGWTVDPDTADPLVVVAQRDGTQVASFDADVPRADVAAANPGYGPNHGFSATLPEGPEGDHQLCLTAINRGTGTDISLGCRSYTVDHNPNGSVDAVTRTADKVVVKGWATDPDSPATPILVDLQVDAKYVRTTTADLNGAAHGYEFTVAAADSGTHEVCVLGWNSGPGVHTIVGCKSYSRPVALTTPAMEPLVKDHSQYYGRNEVRWGVGDQVVQHVKVEKSITEGSWGTVYDQDGSIRQWVDTNVGAGQRACYRVTVSNDRPSTAQSTVCGVSLLPAPAGPTDTRVTAVGDTTVSLAWTDRATAENGYRVDVSAPGKPSRSINLPADAGTATVAGLDPLTVYTFLVRPVQDTAANVEDAQAGRVTATTTGALAVTSLTADPAQVTACQAVDVKLTYSVAGAGRVKVERVVGTTVTTVFDQSHGLERWDNTVSGGSNDGGVTYVLTAYAPDNTSVRKALTVDRTSQNLMANTILFYNNSNSVMNVGFYDASGTVLITDLGQVGAKQYKHIQLPSCQKVLVGVKAPLVKDWIYLQSWLGHAAEGEKTAELHNYPTP